MGSLQALPRSHGGEEFSQEAVSRDVKGDEDFSDGPGSQERGAQAELALPECSAHDLF